MSTPQRFLRRMGARRLLWRMQKLLGGAKQSGQLSRALLDDHIGSRVLRRQTHTLRKSGEQNNWKSLTSLANFGNELKAIHRRHSVIRDDQIYRLVLQYLQCFAATTGGEHLISQFLEYGLASRIAVGVIVYQQNPCWISAAAG